MEIIMKIWKAPEIQMMNYILGSYIVLYVSVFILTRIFITVRRADNPPIDRIAIVTLLWSFILHTILPIFVIINMSLTRDFSSVWYFLPYAVVAVVNILIIISLFGRRSPKVGKQS